MDVVNPSLITPAPQGSQIVQPLSNSSVGVAQSSNPWNVGLPSALGGFGLGGMLGYLIGGGSANRNPLGQFIQSAFVPSIPAAPVAPAMVGGFGAQYELKEVADLKYQLAEAKAVNAANAALAQANAKTDAALAALVNLQIEHAKMSKDIDSLNRYVDCCFVKQPKVGAIASTCTLGQVCGPCAPAVAPTAAAA